MAIDPTYPITIRNLERVRNTIASEAKNVRQIAAELHMCADRARKYLNYLHEQEECHIAKWDRKATSTRYPIAMYKMGKRKDAKKPPRITSAQRQAAYIAKLKKDPERWMIYRDRDRTKKRMIPANDELMNALYGRAA